MRLKSRIKRLEEQMRGLRCVWCSYSVFDVAPPLPFLPNKEVITVAVYACCWQCGSKFNISGDSLRRRQVSALYYSTNPAEAYTNESARAVFAYLVRHNQLSQRRAEASEPGAEAHTDSYHQEKKQTQKMSAKARARSSLYQRAMADIYAQHEKLRKLYGELPSDTFGKTFVELETIIFGDASAEAHALDAEWAASGASEEV